MKNAGEEIARIIQNGDIQELNIEKLKLVMLYGSRARGNYSNDSDLDLAFLFSKEALQRKNSLKLRIKLAGKLEKLLQIETDVVILNEAPPLLKYQVIKYGKVIYSASDFSYNSYYSKVIKEYFDYKHLRKIHDKQLFNRVSD